MARFGKHTRLGLVLLAIYAALWTWQAPGWLHGPLTQAEIDYHLAQFERHGAAPGAEKPAMLAAMRAWAEADDGKPVYMVNMMRYFDEVRRYPGAPPFDGTPREANAYYESRVLKQALVAGNYPIFGGPVQSGNLVTQAEQLNHWSEALVMRYPSRRAVLELLCDPEYLAMMPYKLMALQVVLTPVSGQLVLPDLRWLGGFILLAIFLGAGWWRAARASP